MSPSEEEFERIEVRQKWPSESYDFTPWLADNLDSLGNEIGMRLDLVQMEKAVGPMSLDILAREVDTGNKVAIENQLEWSNTLHLGQLLTYSGGCDVRVAIWVATGFSYEYAEALDWLNRMTKEGGQFYAVKVEVVRKADDTELEARFRKVVYPGGWDKEATLPLNQTPPHIQKHRDFFQPLVDKLMHTGFADRVSQAWNFRGRRFAAPFDKDSGYEVYMDRGDVWVTLHIRTWDSVERSNRIFDELHTKRDEIESNFSSALEWRWDKEDKQTFSSINVRRDGTIDDPPDKLDEIRAWMLGLLPKFKEVFDPRMAEILERLPPP